MGDMALFAIDDEDFYEDDSETYSNTSYDMLSEDDNSGDSFDSSINQVLGILSPQSNSLDTEDILDEDEDVLDEDEEVLDEYDDTADVDTSIMDEYAEDNIEYIDEDFDETVDYDSDEDFYTEDVITDNQSDDFVQLIFAEDGIEIIDEDTDYIDDDSDETVVTRRHRKAPGSKKKKAKAAISVLLNVGSNPLSNF